MNATSQMLLSWYYAHRRDLPWRNTADPYAIWVSEIMLQQTQVATVIGYYRRWMQAFPTVTALADASLDRVLAHWQGLGYYSRARGLHRAANAVRDELAGIVPGTAIELQRLPGIGPYTAAAIASIAYGEAAAAVDGNVIRVLARLFDLEDDVTRAKGKNRVQRLAEQLLNREHPGDHNQAIMELGATVCTPRSPLCPECPFAEQCLALERGTVHQRPVKPPRVKPPHHHLAAAYCAVDGRLMLVRRAPQGLLGGLWELPNSEPAPSETDDAHVEHLLLRALSLHATSQGEIARVRHGYTHFTVDVAVMRCDVSGRATATAPWDRQALVSQSEQEQYGVTGVTSRILRALGWPQETA